MIASVPNCIVLNVAQQEKLERFIAFLRAFTANANDESEEVSMASDLQFTVYATGLGDAICCSSYGHQCSLTIDDEGQMPEDEWINAALALAET